jgi:hypothetical protein
LHLAQDVREKKNEKKGFRRKPDNCFLKRGECSQGLVHSGAIAEKAMQQPHLGDVTIYADITEVRQETRAADCKKLLADGWVLLGVYPLTTVGESPPRRSRKGQTEKRLQDTQQRVLRMVGYVMGKKRES